MRKSAYSRSHRWFSASAVDRAAVLAKALGARMTVMTVTEPFHVLAVDPVTVTATPAEYERLTAEHAGRYLSAAAAEIAAADVQCTTLHVKGEHTYQAIIDTAAKEGCDLIAMSSHGRHGLAALPIGQRDDQGAHPFKDSGARLSLIGG
ncbi:universal stress protein [Vineibacter terrae]|uniref:universal stress protein n=1 Tax=Vineibacter terrae TaxID=2586908 RepID=UPI002E321AE4|nr:universal stress protein [Vineibacter terrae]HEX2892308.1 universal stress protein [Vineibacter terrae]